MINDTMSTPESSSDETAPHAQHVRSGRIGRNIVESVTDVPESNADPQKDHVIPHPHHHPLYLSLDDIQTITYGGSLTGSSHAARTESHSASAVQPSSLSSSSSLNRHELPVYLFEISFTSDVWIAPSENKPCHAQDSVEIKLKSGPILPPTRYPIWHLGAPQSSAHQISCNTSSFSSPLPRPLWRHVKFSHFNIHIWRVAFSDLTASTPPHLQHDQLVLAMDPIYSTHIHIANRVSLGFAQHSNLTSMHAHHTPNALCSLFSDGHWYLLNPTAHPSPPEEGILVPQSQHPFFDSSSRNGAKDISVSSTSSSPVRPEDTSHQGIAPRKSYSKITLTSIIQPHQHTIRELQHVLLDILRKGEAFSPASRRARVTALAERRARLRCTEVDTLTLTRDLKQLRHAIREVEQRVADRREQLGKFLLIRDSERRLLLADSERKSTLRSDIESCHLWIRSRQSDLFRTLLSIYPISFDASDGRFFIRGIALENSVFNNSMDERIAIALGYTSHLVSLCAYYLHLSPRYPILHAASRSKIIDPLLTVSSSLSPRSPSDVTSPETFPLYPRGSDRLHFQYAVFLLNKDIEQLMHAMGLKVANLRHTLPNMLELFAHMCQDFTARTAPVLSGWPTAQTRAGDKPPRIRESQLRTATTTHALTNAEEGVDLTHPREESLSMDYSAITISSGWGTARGEDPSGQRADTTTS